MHFIYFNNNFNEDLYTLHRRLADVRLREGDGLFTEKLARGLDPSFLDQYSTRARRRLRGVNLSSLSCAGKRRIFSHFLHPYFIR